MFDKIILHIGPKGPKHSEQIVLGIHQEHQ